MQKPKSKPAPEDIARVAAARAVAGLPENAERSRKIAVELAEGVTRHPQQKS